MSSDNYFRIVAQYIHLNSIELFEPDWKRGKVRDFALLENKIRSYPHSSFQDYIGGKRPQSAILDSEAIALIGDEMPVINEILLETLLYYRDLQN